MRKVFLNEFSSSELERMIGAGEIDSAITIFGSCESHGPHLPLGPDLVVRVRGVGRHRAVPPGAALGRGLGLQSAEIGLDPRLFVVVGGDVTDDDIGIDAGPRKFLDAIAAHPGCVVGLSALLTTTMANMEKTVSEIKTKYPACPVLVGGAPLSAGIAEKMGADGYGKDARQALVALSAFAGRLSPVSGARRE